MTSHLHQSRVEGCFRCDLSADEADVAPQCVDECDDWSCAGECAFDGLTRLSEQAGLYDTEEPT